MKRILFALSLVLASCATSLPPATTAASVSTPAVTNFEEVELMADEMAYVEATEGAPLFLSTASESTAPARVASVGKPLFVLGVYDGWYRVRHSDNRVYYTRPYRLSKLKRTPQYTRNTTPAYVPAYSAPSSSGSSSRSIQTGPRGGKYYINKNGNKTYIKR